MFLSKNGGIYFFGGGTEFTAVENPCAFGHKKSKRGNILAYFYFFKLFLCGSAYRACICTSTAVNALICINFILAVAFADSLNRTLSSTSAA